MRFEVVVVRRGLTGREFFLHCRSDATRDLPPQKHLGTPRGTAFVERMDDLGVAIYTSDEQRFRAAESIARESLVFGDGWIALKWRAFRISFDRCATWRSFESSRMLAPHVPGTTTSGYSELYTQHPIEYQDLKVEPRGGESGEPRIAFVVRSKALTGSGARRVESLDGGRTWSIRNEDSPRAMEPERVSKLVLATVPGLKLSLVHVQGRAPPGAQARDDQFVVCESGSSRATRVELERGVPPNATLVGDLTNIGWGPSPPRAQGASALEWWAPRAREALALGPGWVAWKRDILRFSLDGCATWRVFTPWKAIAPQEIIVYDAVSSRCSDEGCAQASFQSRALPEYRDLSVARGGRAGEESLAFTLRLETLDAGGERNVWSTDGGRSWMLRRRGPP